MPWFRVDDGWHSHPKVLAAGNAASGLWVRCGAYCAQHLTDGFVSEQIAKMYGTTAEIRRLVDVKLWIKVDGGFQITDWADYQPTADQVRADRAAAANRQRRRRQNLAADTPDDTAVSRRDFRRDSRMTVDGSECEVGEDAVSADSCRHDYDGSCDEVVNGTNARSTGVDIHMSRRDLRRESHDPGPARPNRSNSTTKQQQPTGSPDNAAAAADPEVARCIDLAVAARQRSAAPEIRNPQRWAAAVRRNITSEHATTIATALANGTDPLTATAQATGIPRTELLYAKHGGGYA